MQKPLWGVSAVLLAFLVPQVPVPAGGTPCLVTHDQLPKAIRASVQPTGGPSNGGLDNSEWAAAVARDGTVCALTFSGGKPQDQWPASRGIAVEKANTAKSANLQASRCFWAKADAPNVISLRCRSRTTTCTT